MKKKYTVIAENKYSGFDPKIKKFFASMYVVEENTTEDWFIDVTCDDVLENEPINMTIVFKNYQDKIIIKPYEKELFECIRTKMIEVVVGSTANASNR